MLRMVVRAAFVVAPLLHCAGGRFRRCVHYPARGRGVCDSVSFFLLCLAACAASPREGVSHFLLRRVRTYIYLLR